MKDNITCWGYRCLVGSQKIGVFIVLAYCLLILALLFHFTYEGDNHRFHPAKISDVNSPTVEPLHLGSPTVESLHANNVGYIFASHYSDQLVGATANLMSLQCWASTLPGRVVGVEPFVKGAIFGTSLVHKNRRDEKFDKLDLFYDNNTIKMSDLYDKAQWSNYASSRSFSPLIGWDEFLRNSPMPIIAVDRYTQETEKPKEFHSLVREFAQKYNFTVVREVYYSVIKTYTTEELKELIYGSLHPAQFVVIFSIFGGFKTSGGPHRLKLSGAIGDKCSRKKVVFRDSSRITQESSSYIEKYLPGKQHISVMLRMEFFSARLQDMSREKQLSIVQTCIQAIVNQVSTLKKSTGTSSVFVTTDSGKYGSEEMRSIFHEGVLENAIQMLYKQLYNDSVTVDMFSSLVDEIATIHNRGYVALLERVVAAKGRCLVLAGGGSFQGLASNMYRTYHKGESLGCVVPGVHECRQ